LFAQSFNQQLKQYSADTLRCSLQLYCYHWLLSINWSYPLLSISASISTSTSHPQQQNLNNASTLINCASYSQFVENGAGAIQYFGAPSVPYLLLHEMCDSVRLQQQQQSQQQSSNADNNSNKTSTATPQHQQQESIVGMLVMHSGKLISAWGVDENFIMIVRKLCQLYNDTPRLIDDWIVENAVLNSKFKQHHQDSLSNNASSNIAATINSNIESLLEPRIYMPNEQNSSNQIDKPSNFIRSTSQSQKYQERVTRLCIHRHGTMTLMFLFECSEQ
jgi:hypothetical protein